MESTSGWPWHETLAVAADGDVVQIRQILFGMIQDYLTDMGVRTGSVLECIENRPNEVLVKLPTGEDRLIGWDYAWFISVTRGVG